MRQSITQKFDYGCGIACFAFATKQTYEQAEKFLGSKQALSTRFWCKNLAAELNSFGLAYQHKYIKPSLRKKIYKEKTIVLIARSKHYPAGHYLIRHNNQWMDPWINLPCDKNIKNARSGFRKRLPGNPIYAILPFDYGSHKN
jgi:hypothetical protein